MTSRSRLVAHSKPVNLTRQRETRNKLSSKGKARADEVQETDDDAYGSDDPSYLPNARTGHEREEDGTTQGSPKGHKRSRLNSAGEGAPVQIKTERTKPSLSLSSGTRMGALPVILRPSNSYPFLLVMFRAQLFAFNCTTFLPTIMSNSVQVLISI